MTTAPEPTTRVPYAPALDVSSRALAVAALVVEGVELGIGPHREISAIFLGVGLAVGYLVGRTLARQLREWVEQAPVLDATEAAGVHDWRPAPLAVAAFLALTAVAIVIPITWHVPTPLPGALAAAAIQALLQARVLRDIEAARRGEVVRPDGQLSFDGSELRIRM